MKLAWCVGPALECVNEFCIEPRIDGKCFQVLPGKVMSEAGKEKRFFEGCVKRPLIFCLFPYFLTFNGGSFILLQVNWCSREFSLHSVKGNHIHLTLVHLEEETLPFSFSPPVSPLVRQANSLVGGEICLPRCLLLLLATRSKLWQTLSTPGRSEELQELDTISLLVLALWALEREKQRLAILHVLEKLSDSTWFSFCHCIHAQQKAAPLWPWTMQEKRTMALKEGKEKLCFGSLVGYNVIGVLVPNTLMQ